MNPDHHMAQRPDEPTDENAETTEPVSPELLIPTRQLVIQPLSNDVVPDKTEKQEQAEKAAAEAAAVNVEPTSYTEAVEMREAAQAQIAQKPPEVTNEKFVPDPKILPPVVESNTGGIIAIFALIILLGAGAFAWYYFKVK